MMRGIVLRLLCVLAAFASVAGRVEIRAARVSTQPLLGPESGWNSFGVFNAAAVKQGERTVLLFRAQDAKQTSRIGYAESTDGLHFRIRPEPVLSPEADYERDGGVEDPRVVLIQGTYYMTYTAYDRRDAQLALATSNDLTHWERKGVLMPANKGTWNTKWTKSGAIVPQQINGKWWMYYLGTKKDPDGKERDYMGLACSPDLLHWSDATKQPVLERRPGAFDSRVMEPGPAPYVSDRGILLIYNGANEALVYGPGWVLFDKNDPSKVLARSDRAFAVPELEWERKGNVPNVIFVEGAVQDSAGELTAYYGAADKYIGAMRVRVSYR